MDQLHQAVAEYMGQKDRRIKELEQQLEDAKGIIADSPDHSDVDALRFEVNRLSKYEKELADAIQHHQFLDETLNKLYGEHDKLREALEEIIRFYRENFADGYGMAAVNIAEQALKGGETTS